MYEDSWLKRFGGPNGFHFGVPSKCAKPDSDFFLDPLTCHFARYNCSGCWSKAEDGVDLAT